MAAVPLSEQEIVLGPTADGVDAPIPAGTEEAADRYLDQPTMNQHSTLRLFHAGGITYLAIDSPVATEGAACSDAADAALRKGRENDGTLVADSPEHYIDT